MDVGDQLALTRLLFAAGVSGTFSGTHELSLPADHLIYRVDIVPNMIHGLQDRPDATDIQGDSKFSYKHHLCLSSHQIACNAGPVRLQT